MKRCNCLEVACPNCEANIFYVTDSRGTIKAIDRQGQIVNYCPACRKKIAELFPTI